MALGVQVIIFSLLMGWTEESHCEATRVPEQHCKRDHGKIKNEPNYSSQQLELLDQLILGQMLSTCTLNLPAAPFPKLVIMQIWS